MHIDQARVLLERVRGLYPFTTLEQGQFLLTEFLIYEGPVVARAIDAYAAWREHLSPAVLLDRIRRDSASAQAAQKRLEAAEAAALVAARRDEEKRKADERHAEIDRTIAALDDDTLARLKAAVVAQIREESRSFIEGRDPRTSATLKALIVEAMEGEAAGERRAAGSSAA